MLDIAKNRKLLQSIISRMVCCGQQNIALQGHNESLSDEGNNPLALVKFRAKYTSATIQNKLTSIIGEQLGESIVGQIPRNTSFYLILADEVTDVANKEQLSLAVFVDNEGTIQEEFSGFLSLERITREAIPSVILDVLPKWNLNIKNCRARDTTRCQICHRLACEQHPSEVGKRFDERVGAS